jgi:hypothetical protein
VSTWRATKARRVYAALTRILYGDFYHPPYSALSLAIRQRIRSASGTLSRKKRNPVSAELYLAAWVVAGQEP